jgi:hypothetical protein
MFRKVKQEKKKTCLSGLRINIKLDVLRSNAMHPDTNITFILTAYISFECDDYLASMKNTDIDCGTKGEKYTSRKSLAHRLQGKHQARRSS